MPGVKDLSTHSALTLWGGLSLLLSIGLITTLVDLTNLPKKEGARAYAERQRFVVNPATSEVSLALLETEKPEEAFDVGTSAPAPAKQENPSPPTEAAPEAPQKETPPEDMPALRTEPLKQDALLAPSPSKHSLVAAPAREVSETVDELTLPKRGDKGVTPATLYAQPFTHKPDQVVIAWVVMHAGLDPQSTGMLMALPKEITAAYSPYARGPASNSEALRVVGHEVWTMLPAMSDRYPHDDPGPLGLIAQMPTEEMLRRLKVVLSTVPGSVGLLLAPNESITSQKNALADVLKEVDARGLLFATSQPTRSIEQITSDKALAAIVRRVDLVLDADPSEEQIRSKLAVLLAAAKEKGEYIVALSDQPQTLNLLKEWLEKNPLPEGYAFAPLSAMYRPGEAAEEVPEAAKEGGHGGGEEKKKEKKKPKEKPAKPLPQDKYLKPAGAESGGHGGGESGGH